MLLIKAVEHRNGTVTLTLKRGGVTTIEGIKPGIYHQTTSTTVRL